MNTARQRCRSEQLATTRHTAVRIVPPHKAAKLREAQLRHGGSSVHLANSTSLAYRHASLNTDTLPSQATERVSSPTSTSHPPATSSRSPGSRFSQPKSSETKQQLDGAAPFPNIDAVIADSRSRDKRRAMAETEFYEQTDEKGVVRRTSILRPVNREDCLVARGANPRTGLITPEANSVADSLDFGKRFTKNRQDSSAQWRLDGDQWVSSMVAQTQPAARPTPSKPQVRPLERVAEEYLSPVHAQSRPRRDFSPLTESNLHQLASEQRPMPSAAQAQAASPTPPGICKVRRKPVGSPSQRTPEAHIGRAADRQPSNETVVRTPLHDRHNTSKGGVFTYFHPEDVGGHLGTNVRPQPTHASPVESSFLGLPVKLRSMTARPIRGFTAGNRNLDQLQQSLRTSSGPYPLPASKQQSTPIREYRELYSTGLPYRKQHELMETSRDEERLYRQRVPKAYLPDTAISFDRTRRMQQRRDYREHPRPPRSMLGPRAQNHAHLMVEDPPDQAIQEDLNPYQKSNIMCMSTDTSTSSFRNEAGKDLTVHPVDVVSSQTMLQHRSATKCPVRANVTDTMSGHSVGQSTRETFAGDSLPAERRPPMGPRSQEVRNVSKPAEGATSTASEHRSNMTGTKVDQSDEDEKSEDSKTSNGNESPILAEPGAVSNDGDELVLLDPLDVSTARPAQREETDLRDHSICCPECCIQFDCHEGCLGHPSPAISLAESETSSLASMGVFDASFETSVQAVNKVLLEPSKNTSSKLAKVKTAFVRGPRPRPSSPTKSFTGQDLMRRTMRKSPAPREVGQKSVGGSRKPDTRLAVTAAVRAMDANDNSTEEVTNRERPESIPHGVPAYKADLKSRKKRQAAHEANEGRRVSGKAEVLSDRTVSGPREAADEVLPEPHSQGDDNMSMLSRMSSLVRRPKLRWSCMDKHPKLLSHTQGLLSRLKEMVFVVLDTTSLISVMVLEYKREGRLVVPKGVSTSELFGDIVRSMLYLMIAACIYAWVVRVLRAVLVVVRVLLIPVRICAWVIG